MATRTRAPESILPEYPSLRPSRKDLFALAQPVYLAAGSEAPSTVVAIRQLWTMGLHIRELAPGHWVIRGAEALPEIHLYSELEVQRFASRNALHYAPCAPKAGAEEITVNVKETA